MASTDFTRQALDAARRIIVENGDYRGSNSTFKAEKYVDALNTMIPLHPDRVQFGGTAGESAQWSTANMIKMRDSAEKWIHAVKLSRRKYSYAHFCRFRS